MWIHKPSSFNKCNLHNGSSTDNLGLAYAEQLEAYKAPQLLSEASPVALPMTEQCSTKYGLVIERHNGRGHYNLIETVTNFSIQSLKTHVDQN